METLLNDHFHCRMSPDSSAPLTEMCKAAEAAGIYDICLTDHCDVIDEHGVPADTFSWDSEDQELATVKGNHVTVRRGVELGEAIWRPERAKEVLSSPDIDFVLGSMHNSREGEDYYWLKYTTKEQCEKLLAHYFEDILALARSDYYDSLAHLTYPIRYMTGRDGIDLDLHTFDDIIREILSILLDKGRALELNTSGFRQNGGVPFPPDWVLWEYRKMGGDLITIGSDAHEPKFFASGIQEGFDLLRACGFRYVTKYVKRRPEQVSLY